MTSDPVWRDPVAGAAGLPGPTWSALSELGGRRRNEDRWGHKLFPCGCEIWVVADGMGGHADGDLAAEVAVLAFLEAAATAGENARQAVVLGMSAARAAVGRLAEGRSKADAPSTTLIGVAAGRDGAFVGHCGDSALFQYRGDRLLLRTQDHNVREHKRLLGNRSDLPAYLDPDAAQLTRSLGQPLAEGVDEAIAPLDLQPGDRLLICSDGIWQHLSETEPAAWQSGIANSQECLDRLLAMVTRAALPQQDNYTAIVIDFGKARAGPARLSTKALWAAAAAAVLAVLSLVALASGYFPQQTGAPPLPPPVVKAQLPPPVVVDTGQPVPVPIAPAPDSASAGTISGAPAAAPVAAQSRQCRTVIEPQKRCDPVAQPNGNCSSEAPARQISFSDDFDLEGAFANDGQANALCRERGRNLVAGQGFGGCQASVAQADISCSCAVEPETPGRAICRLHISAVCASPRPAKCTPAAAPKVMCRVEPVARQICD